jgi:hypothetical protein
MLKAMAGIKTENGTAHKPFPSWNFAEQNSQAQPLPAYGLLYAKQAGASTIQHMK